MNNQTRIETIANSRLVSRIKIINMIKTIVGLMLIRTRVASPISELVGVQQ